MSAAAPIFSLDQFEYQNVVTASLRLVVANDRSPVKALAETAGSSVAAAKHWYAGSATPNGIYMSRLRAAYPDFDAEIRRLEGLHHNMDPMFHHAFAEAMQHFLRTPGGAAMAQAMMAQFGGMPGKEPA